jgi:serralysin
MDKNTRACVDVTIARTPLVYDKQGRERKSKIDSLGIDIASFLAPTPAVLWIPGRPVKVRFLDGDPGLQKKVQSYANEWTKYGNLKLEFVSEGDAAIRVAFMQGEGSWSTIGTDAKSVTNQDEPTMNYGWLTSSSSDDEIARVVLHEFGHAVGLAHEHQNVTGGIKWNKEVVYKELSGPPNNWSREQIDHNMFDRYDETIAIYSEFDPKSIMLYPIPKTWTLDSHGSGFDNKELSANDKKFVDIAYPRKG